ncbi:uncharacterized protein DUF3263 [Streptomyces sp. 3211.6]|uniref:DUF3263 domain-containing protein n=1 Tax=unclassified Streptomyces TaxID=2593676 RepID=UPI000EB3A2D4|nr:MULTISPECIES: DUF3263 domain-containing protein [unclassified Streptomyces]RKT06031.1 uncharacterized protein DUF3263 [Streptomyces sp. 3211.6]RPF46428.1 uncharacterized protein DUF3263 [Streptomyces sp. Ag109_G2-6]
MTDGGQAGETGTAAEQTAEARLTDAEAAVLAYEGRSWPGPGAKERAIREGLGLTPVRYYQLLNALMDDPRALAHAPGTVNRLRRIREAQRARR